MIKCLVLFLLLLLVSCDKNILDSPTESENTEKNVMKLDSLYDQTISMNSQFGPYKLTIKNNQTPIESLVYTFRSSNETLVDSNSIELKRFTDSVTFTIYPIIGRDGISQITIIVKQKGVSDSLLFNLTVTKSNNNRSYPTTLLKLNSSEYLVKQNELKQMLGSNYTATLDSFGSIGHLTGLLQRGQSSLTETDQAVAKAKTALLFFSKYTNTTDTSLLIIQEAKKNNSGPPPTFTDWTITFKNQSYNKVEVWDSRILILIKDGLISMDWHHYKSIYIPIDDLISKERVKKRLVGKVISYDCWTPSTYAITDASIKTESMSLCIYPLQLNNKTELRVTWKVPVSFSGSSIGWYYFIDVLTGETVGVEQLFIC